MSIYVVWMQDEKETLIFVLAKSEDEVRNIVCEMTSTNFDIRGTIGDITTNDRVFSPNVPRLLSLASSLRYE